MEQLMRANLKDDWGILELQNAILNIARYIHNFCENNKIKYCIIGGTALGAVRHAGFIPWDDDLDVFMTLDDYEKFRQLFRERGDKDNYYLQEIGESNGRIACAKLRCNNSTYVEDSLKDKDIHHGIFVDIFIIHNCPEHKFGQYWIMFWENYIVFKDMANRGYKKRGKIYAFLFKMLRILPKRMLLNFALKQIYRYRNTDCPYYCHMYGKLSLRRGLYDKDIFDHYDLVDFETIKLRCPRNIKKWLTAFYGNYMKIPDLSSIRYAQHSCEWSVDKPFEKRGKGLFIDEKYMLN